MEKIDKDLLKEKVRYFLSVRKRLFFFFFKGINDFLGKIFLVSVSLIFGDFK